MFQQRQNILLLIAILAAGCMQVKFGTLKAQRIEENQDSNISFDMLLMAIAASRRFRSCTNLKNTLK
ncbi:hypothetical protein BV378_27055 [Nostoc sp. RF31YmG]|nr:hypothetical protein BV378_27055 [Nostoc sp. RF31YmG]